jgi:hypothetical protein
MESPTNSHSPPSSGESSPNLSPFSSPSIHRTERVKKEFNLVVRVPRGKRLRKKNRVQPDDPPHGHSLRITRMSTSHLSATYVDNTRLNMKGQIERRLADLERQRTRATKELGWLETEIDRLTVELNQIAPPKDLFSQMCVIV